MSLSSKFAAHLCQQYPALQNENLESLISPNMISPHKVALPESIRTQIQHTIETFEALRNLPAYRKWVAQKFGPQFDPGNQAVFMSYDFHVTPEGQLKLIEINTNASFLGLGWEMFKFHKVPWNADFEIQNLKNCFAQEMQLAGFKGQLKNIAITDENPTEQKLYSEFLIYRELFNSWGFNTVIADVGNKEALESADFIYNRSTDFYFETDRSQILKKLYLDKKAVVSPQPYEYRLLADKENFVEWSRPQFWNEVPEATHLKDAILKVLPRTYILSEATRDQAWAERKYLFFKPKRAFGSKMTFKGASIARKAFDDLLRSEALAQELVPPAELSFGDQSFKYDLRCYAYRNQFQGCLARLYQGQVTNLRTEGGGFTCVEFKS